MKKVIAIVGPTASGKTAISVELARMFGTEIISADSRLVYKDFNIGTAKPSTQEMRGIKHHLIDVVPPTEIFTASRFKQEAGKLLETIERPIIAGGTGFYIKAVLGGLDMPESEPDEEFRKEMQKLDKYTLHNKLRDCDPAMAEKLHFNDTFRIIRALEVYHLSGIPMSQAQSMTKPKYDVIYIGLTAADREYLYNRINQRVLDMIEQGLVKEVENLINKYGKTLSLLRTLGYKEVCHHIEGEISLEEAVEKIQKNTRNFAKRQLTWFRSNKNIKWFNIDEMGQAQILQNVKSHLTFF